MVYHRNSITFWVNYVLFLLNMLLIGFPMDGGRLFQSVMWKYVGYRRATLAAVYAGFVTMFVVGVYSIAAKGNFTGKTWRILPFVNVMHDGHDFAWEREWRVAANVVRRASA